MAVAVRAGPLLPPQEVYAVLRDNGFSPLGVPHQRGLVYTIAVIDRNGEDGRLVIDARNGRIIRFMPAYRYGQGYGGYGQGYGYNRDPMASVLRGFRTACTLPMAAATGRRPRCRRRS